MFRKCFLFLLLSLFLTFSDAALASDNNFKLDIHVTKTFELEDYELHTELAAVEGRITVDQFYFEKDIFNGKLLLGRQFIKQGPGYFSQLMLSDKRTPLNAVVHRGKFNLQDIENDYMMMIAYLDEGTNKQLFAHRASNDSLAEGLEIGISEAVIASEKINSAYYLPLPYIPYYLISYLTGFYDEYNYHDDKYLGFDFSYQCKNDILVYGELLVDEYPQTAEADNPDKRAHLVGLYYPLDSKTEFRAEYSNVFNDVYLHRFPENRYTYNGKYLGHWLGHDADVLDLQLTRQLHNHDSLEVGLRMIRRGIGDMETDFAADHQQKKFLSTITEKDIILRSAYTDKINEDLSLKLETELGKVFPIEGENEDIFNLKCSINLKL